MSYLITVNTGTTRRTYPAIGNLTDLLAAAYDDDGALGVTVMVQA